MPDYFWNWYKGKGYEDILSKERCFSNKAFLSGCCLEYLMEKGQKITKAQECKNIDEVLIYLKTGVVWTK